MCAFEYLASVDISDQGNTKGKFRVIGSSRTRVSISVLPNAYGMIDIGVEIPETLVL